MRAADLYQQRGWRVLPLHSVRADGTCTCEPRQDGKPCQNKGKHPRQYDWVNLASSDPDALAEWRARYPGANVGIATGFASGFFVLDVDPKNGGDATLARLLSEHGPLPVTAQQATPSGGAHYLFRMPAHPVSNAKVGEGLDIRGDGGQIVAAPSRTTAQYRWVRAPWDTPVAEAPAWLLALLGKGPASPATRPDESARGYFPPASPAVLDAAREALEAHGPAVDGDAGGLHTVHAAAILTHDFALSDDEAWPLFLEWNETCQPPWELEGANSLREKFNNGRKYGKAEYGCKRSMDALETARKRIADWRERDAWLSNDGERDQALENLVREARQLVERGGDPLTRERIQSELIAATGLKAQALALPRVRVRAEPREPTTDQGTWAEYGFDLGTNGSPIANLDNAVRVLEHEQRPIFYEVFGQRVQGPDGEWRDADDLDLTLYMQRRLGLTKMTTQTVNQAVQTYAHRKARDVVREHLERLSWDGTERIADFFPRVYGAEDNEYARAAGANFWKSLSARILKPGCKCDTMVVLEGVQGIQKSTSLRTIAGAHLFAEASESPTSKDFFLALQGKLLVEVAEMDSFSRSEVAAVKRVLSCQVDRFRAPYERATRDWPRRGVFVGTTNRSDWARDDTGGRRFWPIRCTRVDLEYIKANREQLFAEAVHRVQRDEAWWEMPAEATAAEQEARRQQHPWEPVIGEYLSRPGAPAEVTTVELLRNPIGRDVAQMSKADQMQVASVLKLLGWERVDGWRNGQRSKFWRRTRGGDAGVGGDALTARTS